MLLIVAREKSIDGTYEFFRKRQDYTRSDVFLPFSFNRINFFENYFRIVMLSPGHSETLNHSLKAKIRKNTDESVMMCYQCGKCAAGCPLSEDMDFTPNQILRMLQIGSAELDDKILRSMGIWLCLSCEMCYARCPKEVEIPLIMDYLRSESILQNKVNPAAKEILAFHKTFLDSIKLTGRLHEVGLIAGYKLRTLNLLQDIDVAPKLFFSGKLSILPHKIKNPEAVSKIFRKVTEEDKL